MQLRGATTKRRNMNNLPTSSVTSLTLKDVETMANVASKSGLFGIKDPMQAMALMLLCQSEGLHPMTACRQYHVIQGRAAMTSQTMMSKFLWHGGKQQIHSATETEADITLSHPAGGSMRVRWTIEQAQKAGLTNKDNWKNHPRSMLLRRAQAEAVRAVAPFVLEGIPSADEAEEIVPPLPVLEPVYKEVQVEQLVAKTPRVEIVLDKTWDRDTKAKVAKKVKDLGGTVGKEGIAYIAEDRQAEFEEYLVGVMNPVRTEEEELDHAFHNFQG